MSKELYMALMRALDAAPCSDRRLALEAGIDPSLISRIRAGERAVTDEVLVKIAVALKQWGDKCLEASEALLQALEVEGEK